MELDYSVIRLEPAPSLVNRPDVTSLPSGEIFRSTFAGAAGVEAGLRLSTKAIVETTSLSQTQALEAARDPANQVAAVMPTLLIQPCASADFDISNLSDPVKDATEAKQSWGVTDVGAHQSLYSGGGVRVAILDTGIVWSHPAFQGVQRIERNFTTEGKSNDVTDLNGHGTHCTGTALGRDVDGVRIGVARGVETAIVGKVLNKDGKGSTAEALMALHWAASHRANIISMSLGFDFPGMQDRLVAMGLPGKLATSIALKAYRENLRSFSTLVEFLTQENEESTGVVIVAAAGNESLRHRDPQFVIDTSLPAAASRNIISVGATMQTDAGLNIAPFSNVNPVLCAPGVNIVSANYTGGLVAMNGTSMACPHVAGLAALWWESATKSVGRASGGLVQAQLVGSANLSGFLPTVKLVDRGAGRATAPLMR